MGAVTQSKDVTHKTFAVHACSYFNENGDSEKAVRMCQNYRDSKLQINDRTLSNTELTIRLHTWVNFVKTSTYSTAIDG